MKKFKTWMMALPIAAMLFCPLKAKASQTSKTSRAKLEEKLSSCGSLWTNNEYGRKNAKSQVTVQLGVNVLQYKKFTLEPYLEINNTLDKKRLPWNNTMEVNQGIRIKKGAWQLGVKNVHGFYLPNARNTKNTNISLGTLYKELQSYSSVWHGWKKQNFAGEEWAKASYYSNGGEGQSNFVFDGTAEAGVILLKHKEYSVGPFYEIGLTLDTKKLPWNNRVKNSIGVKLKHGACQLGVKAFSESYLLREANRSRQNSGMMLFFKMWGGK